MSLKAWWKDVLVFDGTQAVGPGNTSLRVTVQVYHIPVKAVDQGGNPLAGVSLTLYRADALVDGGITGADGTYTFRHPLGSYRVVARLDTTYLLTNVDLTSEASFSLPTEVEQVEVQFMEFAPPFTSTNLFYVVVGIAAALVLLGILLVKLRRRGGGGWEEVPESAPEGLLEEDQE